MVKKFILKISSLIFLFVLLSVMKIDAYSSIININSEKNKLASSITHNSTNSIKVSPMDKERFWSIIERSRSFDQNISCIFLKMEFTTLSIGEIQQFSQIMSIYTEKLNTPSLQMACKVINGEYDQMEFIYFAWWIISQGQDVYHKVLKDPDLLSELDITQGSAKFEEFGKVANNILIRSKEPLEEYALSDDQMRALDKGTIFEEKFPYDQSKWKEIIPRAIPKLYEKFGK